MADTELMTADETTAEESEFAYPVTVEDAGPATKKISIEIPEDRIKEKLAEQLKTLRREAAIPGFRPGHAPVKLIEKKFGSGIREEVRRNLISESYQQAIEKNKLEVLGEPEFDAAANINTLPDTGPLSFVFTIEVQPEITLPSLTGIPVKKPKIEIKDENVDQAMQNLREQQGTLVPRSRRRGVLAKDLHHGRRAPEGRRQRRRSPARRPARGPPGPHRRGRRRRLRGKQIVGAKVGARRGSIAGARCPTPSHANEAVRDKDVSRSRWHGQGPSSGWSWPRLRRSSWRTWASSTRARRFVRPCVSRWSSAINYDVAPGPARARSASTCLTTPSLELPTKLSGKQVDRVVQRKAMDLLMRARPAGPR